MDLERVEANRESETPSRSTNRLHIFFTTILTLLPMVILDIYLVRQNHGNRRIGVSVMLFINEICHLLSLRYIGYWVGLEVQTNKRGWAIVSWFLFVVIYDIKMYFVMQHIWSSCTPIGIKIDEKTLETAGGNILLANLAKNDSESISDNVFTAVLPKSCDYSLIEKKMLIVCQAILLPGLYLALVGAEHIRSLTSFRHLEEVKMRVFWVVVDMLDILQLQSSMWEGNINQFPYFISAVIYFYCYVLLAILPSISMSEMSKKEHDFAPHKMIFCLFASVFCVNIGTTVIRLILLFGFDFNSTSSIFLAKNTLCIGMQITKLIQFKQLKRKHKDDEVSSDGSDDGQPVGYQTEFILDSRNVIVKDHDKCNLKDLSCSQHVCGSQKISSYGNSDIESIAQTCENKLLEREQVTLSDGSTAQRSISQRYVLADTSSSVSEKNSFSNKSTLGRRVIQKGRICTDRGLSLSTKSELNACSCSLATSSTDCAKQASTKVLCSETESTLASSQNIFNDIPTSSACERILTPPLLYKDFGVKAVSSKRRYIRGKKAPRNLAASLQNELAYLSSPQNLPQATLFRRNSLSLETFNSHPQTSQNNADGSNFSCKCTPIDNFVIPSARDNISESDISDIVLPPLPPCTTLQKKATCTHVPFDNISNYSTSV